MLLIRALAISLVLVTNTWLLNPVRSDGSSRYKRAMAQRADHELSRQAGEPCAAAVVWKSLRQPRSLSSSPSQHRPPATRTRTSRRHTVRSAPAVCTGDCGLDSGLHRGHEAGRGREVARLAQKRDTDDVKHVAYETEHSAQEQGYAGSHSRFTRSLDYEEEVNSSWDKTIPGSSAVSREHHVLYSLDGDLQSSTGAPDYENFSGEVEDLDTSARPALHSGGSGSSSGPSWGSPVPRVPVSWMTALYFSGGREQLRLKPVTDVELPRAEFSLELWVKPEGGQSNPAVIAGGSHFLIILTACALKLFSATFTNVR